jgi:hypothetical protein
MRVKVLSLAALLLTACDAQPSHTPPPEAYRSWKDRALVGLHLASLERLPCATKVKTAGRIREGMLPTDQCFKMTERRRWSGVWVNEFEDSSFHSGRTNVPLSDSAGWWLEPTKPMPRVDGKAWLIEFVGRRTKYAGGYGHMGMFDHEIIVDRVISMKELSGKGAEVTKE